MASISSTRSALAENARSEGQREGRTVPANQQHSGWIMLEGKKERAKPNSSAAQACGLGCAAAGVVLFQVFARDLFPPLPGGETNWDRNLAAGLVAVCGGVVGVMIGSLVDWLRRYY